MVGNDPVNGVDVLGLDVLSDAEWETAKSKFSGLPEWGKVVLHFDDCNRLWKFHPVHQIWVRFGEAREGSNKCCSRDNFFRGPRGFDPRVGDDPWLVRLIDNIVGSPKQIVANKPNLSESLNPGADLAQMRDDAMRAGGDALANAGVVLAVVTPSPTDALLAAGFLHGMMRGAAKTTTGAADDAFTHGMKYADRVRARGVQDPVSHNVPYSLDDGILPTKPIPENNGYNIFQKPGTMNGKDGVFEIGVTKDGVIDHRFFRPN
jgi:hypothetical protein